MTVAYLAYPSHTSQNLASPAGAMITVKAVSHSSVYVTVIVDNHVLGARQRNLSLRDSMLAPKGTVELHIFCKENLDSYTAEVSIT